MLLNKLNITLSLSASVKQISLHFPSYIDYENVKFPLNEKKKLLDLYLVVCGYLLLRISP